MGVYARMHRVRVHRVRDSGCHWSESASLTGKKV